MESITQTKKEKKMVVYIPVDIVHSILRRVPAESLLRFKLVCKQWRSMINDDPLFPKVDMLVIRTECFDNQIPLWEKNDYFIPLGSLPSSSSSSSKLTIYDIKTNTPGDVFQTISPSCRDFLLRHVDDRNWVMWNPFSGEQLDVPHVEPFVFLGLGYCVKTNDYKVVRIYRGYNTLYRRKTAIYSVKSRAWHHIEDFVCHYCQDQGVFANGSLNFLTLVGVSYVVISLDISNEAYSKIPLPAVLTMAPNGFDGKSINMPHLSSLDGRLFLINEDSHDDVPVSELWILQDFGKENGKWNKLITLPGTPKITLFPIAYLKSKEQIVVSRGDRFAWFDLKNNKCIKEVTVKAGYFIQAVSVELTGSVSLDWFNGTAERSSWCYKKKKSSCFRMKKLILCVGFLFMLGGLFAYWSI